MKLLAPHFSAQIAVVSLPLFDRLMREADATLIAVEEPYSYMNSDQFRLVRTGYTEKIINCTAMVLPNQNHAVITHLYPEDKENQEAIRHTERDESPLIQKIRKALSSFSSSAVIVGGYSRYVNLEKSQAAQKMFDFLLEAINHLFITPSYFSNPHNPNLKLGYIGHASWLQRLFRKGTLDDTVVIGMNQMSAFVTDPKQLKKKISLSFSHWHIAPQDTLVLIDNDLNVFPVS
jgi:hypothetical protein